MGQMAVTAAILINGHGMFCSKFTEIDICVVSSGAQMLDFYDILNVDLYLTFAL